MKKVNKKLSLNKSVITSLNGVKGGNPPPSGSFNYCSEQDCSVENSCLCSLNDCFTHVCTGPVGTVTATATGGSGGGSGGGGGATLGCSMACTSAPASVNNFRCPLDV